MGHLNLKVKAMFEIEMVRIAIEVADQIPPWLGWAIWGVFIVLVKVLNNFGIRRWKQ